MKDLDGDGVDLKEKGNDRREMSLDAIELDALEQYYLGEEARNARDLKALEARVTERVSALESLEARLAVRLNALDILEARLEQELRVLAMAEQRDAGSAKPTLEGEIKRGFAS